MEFYYDDIDRDVIILQADGGLNNLNAEAFVVQLEKLIEAGLRKIIVDCSRLEYISTTGIGMLLRLHKRLVERGGDVRIANLKGLAADVIHTVRLDRVFHIYGDVSRARLEYRVQTAAASPPGSKA